MPTIHYTLMPATGGAAPAPILTLMEPGFTPPPPSDTTPPSAPGTPVAGAISSTTVGLSWPPSTDNVGGSGVVGYRVYCATGGGSPALVASPVGISDTITGRTPNTTYQFTVKAIDAAGNLSAASGALEVTTEEAGVGVGGTVATAEAVGTGVGTFGQVLPEGTAFGSLRFVDTDIPCQCDVKTTWPDGSIYYAIVTGDVEAGSLPIEQGEAASGSIIQANPTAAVVLTIGGVAYTAELPADEADADETWLDGPLVVEHIYRDIAPVDPDDDPHPQLRVQFHVRKYGGTKARVHVQIENFQNQAAAITYTYDVAVVVNGSTVFIKTGVAHEFLRGWREVYPVGGLTEAVIHPDLEQYIQGHAIPRYLPDPEEKTFVISGPDWDILKWGGNTPNMGSPGADTDIGPVTDDIAYYLITKDVDCWQYIIKSADRMGSYPYHLREPEGGTYAGIGADRFVSILERPDFYALSSANAWIPGQQLETELSGAYPVYTESHCPSSVFVPYLLTGDRYYADEMAFTANWHLVHHPGFQHTGTWRGTTGLIVGGPAAREGAWSMRNMVDAQVFLPDGHPLKSLLASAISANLTYYDAWANGTPGNPGSPIGRQAMPANVPPHMLTQMTWPHYELPQPWMVAIQPWSLWFVAWMIFHCNRHGFTGGTDYLEQLVQFQLDLMNPSLTGYPTNYGSPGFFYVGVEGETNVATVQPQIVPNATIADCFVMTYETIGDPPTNFNGNYGVYTWVVLRIAEYLGYDVGTRLDDTELYCGTYLPHRPGWFFDAID